MRTLNFKLIRVFLLITISYSLEVIAQDSILSTVVQKFSIDPIGNCYYQNGNDIVRLAKSPASEVRFSMKDLGSPNSFDVSNPMRILVFYADFAVIRILDNNLVLQSELQLRNLGIQQPRVIAGTPDQGIWVYDEITGSLMKLNTRPGTIAATVDLSQLLGKRPNPERLLANQYWIVLAEKEELLVFDQFGTKTRSIRLKSPTHTLQLEENTLRFSEDNQLVSIQLRTGIESHDPIPCNAAADHFILSNQRCWFQIGTNLFSQPATY